MPDQARGFNRWLLAPPVPPAGFRYFLESASPDLVWRLLGLDSEIPEEGRKLFSGSLAQRNRLWREFRNYVRQAREYWAAARNVSGTSASLLYYYSFLQLAKAELLLTNPQAIVGQQIRHGLTLRASPSDSITGDTLVVSNGVFPLLYEKRTGRNLPAGTRLPVKRLLANCPEIGFELDAIGLVRPAFSGLVHAVVSDGTNLWSIAALTEPAIVKDRSVTARLFQREYKEIDPPPNWRDVFAVTRRFYGLKATYFESRRPRPITNAGDDFLNECKEVWRRLRLLLDQPFAEAMDGTICGSLFKSRLIPMPSSLARYAATFYMSWLVRYRPSRLDPQSAEKQAWLLDALTAQAPLPALIAALAGIKSMTYLFYSSSAARV